MALVLPGSLTTKAPGVGSFNVTLQVGTADRSEFRTVEALVDTGATFSRVPASLLQELGHQPQSSARFKIAAGNHVEYGEAPDRIGNEVRTTTFIWDEHDDGALSLAWSASNNSCWRSIPSSRDSSLWKDC